MLEAGLLHGMTQGSIFEVYPPGTKSFDDPAKASARVEVVSVEPYQSRARRIGAGKIEDSSRAVERQHHFQGQKVRLHISLGESGVLEKLREAVAGEGRTIPNNPRSPSFAQAFEPVAAPANAKLLIKEAKTPRGSRTVVLSGSDGTERSPPAAVNEAGALELILDQLAGWARRHGSAGERANIYIAGAGESGVLEKLREAVAGKDRIDPTNPGSPAFSEAFQAVAEPSDAQLLVKKEKSARGAWLIKLSHVPRKTGLPEDLFQTLADEAGAVDLTLERLAAWAKWFRLLDLDNPQPRLQVDFEIRSSANSGLTSATANGPDLSLVEGQEAQYVVRNRSDSDVYFAILDLATDGSVEVIYPGEGRNEALAPHGSFERSVQAFVPEGKKAIRDYLKLVVTQSPVDFRFLRQEAVKEVPQDLQDPLAELLGQSALIQKHVLPIPMSLDGWATKIKTLEVVEKP